MTRSSKYSLWWYNRILMTVALGLVTSTDLRSSLPIQRSFFTKVIKLLCWDFIVRIFSIHALEILLYSFLRSTIKKKLDSVRFQVLCFIAQLSPALFSHLCVIKIFWAVSSEAFLPTINWVKKGEVWKERLFAFRPFWPALPLRYKSQRNSPPIDSTDDLSSFSLH